MKTRILTVVGTRPNFIKVTQLDNQLSKYPDKFEHKLVHTGQHFDENMSKVFFSQLNLREPDFYLDIHEGTAATQVGNIIAALNNVILEYRPELMIVVGDVNSTLAGAIAANKSGVKLAHVESGLRSRDRSMPEEINRILTDEITDIYFITEKSGEDNLIKEGKIKDNIYFVGNTMIDAIVAFNNEIEASPVLENLELKPKEYILMTMHRPATVDHEAGLKKLIHILQEINKKYKIVFPIHPRTRQNLKKFGLDDEIGALNNLILTPPIDYLAFQKLILYSKFILTDSGGIQEETTFRQVPCLTLRPNTERPSTVELGTNELIPFDVNVVLERIASIEKGTFKQNSSIPPLWDGAATERIVKVLLEYFQ